MCEYCERLTYIKDTLTPSSGFRVSIIEHGREYGGMRNVGDSIIGLLVNYTTPYGNGMMAEVVPINNCPMCGRELRKEGYK